jgi:hypothetical protein
MDRTEIYIVTIGGYMESLCGEHFGYHLHDTVGIIRKHWEDIGGFCWDFTFEEVSDGDYKVLYRIGYDWDREGCKHVSYARLLTYINHKA